MKAYKPLAEGIKLPLIFGDMGGVFDEALGYSPHVRGVQVRELFATVEHHRVEFENVGMVLQYRPDTGRLERTVQGWFLAGGHSGQPTDMARDDRVLVIPEYDTPLVIRAASWERFLKDFYLKQEDE